LHSRAFKCTIQSEGKSTSSHPADVLREGIVVKDEIYKLVVVVLHASNFKVFVFNFHTHTHSTEDRVRDNELGVSLMNYF
jgi:hypothetical protein